LDDLGPDSPAGAWVLQGSQDQLCQSKKGKFTVENIREDCLKINKKSSAIGKGREK
jgi:hypothetical protein